VIGTRFAVSREESTAAVEVTEGVVRVIADGQSVAVRAGERWPAARTAALDADEPPAAEPELTMDPMALDAPRRRAPKRRQVRDDRPIELPPAPPAPSARERFERAAALEASDPAAAAAIYREVARGSGPWAANALYAHARLEIDRGHRDAGRRLMRKYLDRFPDGPNAAEALEALGESR